MIFIFFRKDNNSVLSHIKYNGDANDNLDIYIYIYTTSEKPVNDQSYGVLDRYGITILYK